MFFNSIFAAICIVGFIISVAYILVKQEYLVGFAFFGCLFMMLGIYIIYANCMNLENAKATSSDAEVATAMLSYYVPLGATESENYYIEVTEDNHYKFCYFEPDGSTISRVQIPADENGVEVIPSNTDLPFRVDFYNKGDKVVAVKIHIPDDANAIQFDTDGK